MLLHSIQPTSHYLSLDPSLSIPYHQRVKQIVEHTRSQIVLLNPEHQHTELRTIMAMNRSIKKINGLKEEVMSERRKMMSWAHNTKVKTISSNSYVGERKKKDLIAMTERVREQVDNI